MDSELMDVQSSDDSHADTVEIDVFIVNRGTGEIHHRNFETAQCQLNEIIDAVVPQSLAQARREGLDLCGWCFRSRM